MASGKVRFFSTDKGYGFIEPDTGGPDIFVHIKDLRIAGLSTLSQGQRLNFDTEPGRNGKGPKACKITVAQP